MIHNTLPSKDANYWQFDFLPSISILRIDYTKDEDYIEQGDGHIYKYYSIIIQWLFWSLNWQINK